jgi:hypothetical protein
MGSMTDVERIRGHLAESADGDPKIAYEMLVAIGREGDASDRPLVEPFLARHDDPLLVREALRVLNEWGLAHKYRTTVVQLMEGQSWDEYGEAQDMAMYCAGELAYATDNSEMLERLVRIAEDETRSEETREQAMYGVALALGATWRDLPSVDDDFGPGTVRGKEVLETARLQLRH